MDYPLIQEQPLHPACCLRRIFSRRRAVLVFLSLSRRQGNELEAAQWVENVSKESYSPKNHKKGEGLGNYILLFPQKHLSPYETVTN